jgi:hypothetical protein
MNFQQITDRVAFACHELSHLVPDAIHGAKVGTIKREIGGAWVAESDFWDHFHVDENADATAHVQAVVSAAVVAGPAGELLARLHAEGITGELATDAILEKVRLGTLWSSYAARSDREMLELIGTPSNHYLACITEKILPDIEAMMVRVGHRRLLGLGVKMYAWTAGRGVRVDLDALQRGELVTTRLEAPNVRKESEAV